MSFPLTEVERRLWVAADDLRANSKLKSSEYSVPVLGLIFLRYADYRFERVDKQLKAAQAASKGPLPLSKARYQAAGVLFLPEAARFDRLLWLPEGTNIGAAINDAMRAIEAENDELKDVLPKTYNRLDNSLLVSLLKTLAALPTMAGDAFGRVYEYFLAEFAKAEGQKGGEFYTPTSIVRLIVEVIEPFHGRIFDPSCGSGGMFVQSAAFVQRHQREPGKEISIYGQEKVAETVRLCRMNLAVHGLSGEIRQGNTYYEDLHGLAGKFDFVIAGDIVAHFMGRGYTGKAMVVSIDKARAVRIYTKVRAAWIRHHDELQRKLTLAPEEQHASLRERIAFMEATDMAVIISQSQGEIDEFKKKGLDIKPHRQRMVNEDLETKFKDAGDPLRIVFVCAMWMTGFDVPSCSTVYLDKPMRNHTLMQTIARANRVYGGKTHGLIVDYVGVFRNLQQALAIYGAGPEGQPAGGELPVKSKGALLTQLQEALAEAQEYCPERGVEVEPIIAAPTFERIRLVGDAVELLIVNDVGKRRFLELADKVDRAFRAILPDERANEFGPLRAAFVALAARVRSHTAPVDIDGVMAEVNALLDRSIAPDEGYIIKAPVPTGLVRDASGEYQPDHLVDLSRIDFAAIQARFAAGRKHTEVDKLRGLLTAKLNQMIRVNKTRLNYLETFERLIADYNAGATSIDELFAQLFRFTQELSIEEERHLAEQLSEEELALLDRIVTPEVALSKTEREQVKQLARALLASLKRERLVLDWRKKQQARAAVQVAIEESLSDLPGAYDGAHLQQTVAAVYQHIYDNYASGEQSTYTKAA